MWPSFPIPRHDTFCITSAILALIILPSSLCVPLTANQVFTFNDPSNSFMELRPSWPLSHTREVAFRFKTLRTHTLLMYHSVLSSDPAVSNYELYVQLENARLKIIHIFKDKHETLLLGYALNQDRWHEVILKIDTTVGKLAVTLDKLTGDLMLKSLSKYPQYGLKDDHDVEGPESVVYFGGLDPTTVLWDRQYSYNRFVGCLGNIILKTDDVPTADLELQNSTQLLSGCINRCDIVTNFCLFQSKCINHYNEVTCDCFGTKREGSECHRPEFTRITMRGYSYITYKIYDWDDKVHSDSNRISITFRTQFDNSVLFYASGENPRRNYIAATLVNKSVHFIINLGDGERNETLGLGENKADNWWHKFTVQHEGKIIILRLDKEVKKLHLTDGNDGEAHHYMHFDPLLYIGGLPERGVKRIGIKTRNFFVGSFEEVYFNSISILERLKKHDPEVSYRGIFSPDLSFIRVQMMPVTFPFEESMISITQQRNDSLNLVMDMRTPYRNGLLATSTVVTSKGESGRWELRLENAGAQFLIFLDGKVDSPQLTLNLGERLNDENWHYIGIMVGNSEAELVVDYHFKVKEQFDSKLLYDQRIDLAGTSSTDTGTVGFVGCLREIYIESNFVDPRPIITSEHKQGMVSMDNCQLINPCRRPGVCEHGGHCYTIGGETACNCSGTGYSGETCHFSLFKRTCEELFLVGHREPGIYMIDIDGNGPHPPAPVRCEINPATGATTTTVEHNIMMELDVRPLNKESYRVEVKYRQFTPEMLQTLIQHSKNCTQLMRYECHKAPLKLRSNTWFKSSYSSRAIFHSLGSKHSQHCACGDTKTCVNASFWCNCDVNDGKYRKDEAKLHDPEYLGITDMYFLQPPDIPEDAVGRLILGPLQCIEMDTQQYVVTFKTSESYLDVPGWRTGDLAFSFRTSNSKAVLLYQPSHQDNNYFRVLLVDEHQLLFEYTVDGAPRKMQILSQKPLNSGEWQQVWLDYDSHHVRFTINMDSEMINLDKSEQFGPFDGPLYIGGAPAKYHGQSPVSEGFVGCFRGLVMNEEIVNLYHYLSSRTPQVIKNCKPSCEPNPCLNDAICHEYWGSYSCECSNPLAHSGIHCETNLNTNGITFVTEPAYYNQLYRADEKAPKFMEENILLSLRTYVTNGLILYAHDHFNNFVQLHIQNENEIVFTFNSQRELVQGIVKFRELTRGERVQVFIERFPDKTILNANKHSFVINFPLGLVEKYRQNPWTEGEELELIKPQRPPVEPKNYLQYFLGGINKETMSTTMEGFVGCLTGLKVGANDIDLEKIVTENPGADGFRIDCKMTCDSEPCENDGYCVEEWKSQLRRCNCTYTSYRGKSCHEETAGTFDGQSYIKYKFYPASSIYERVQLKIAFSTDVQRDRPAFLLFVNSKVDERNYIFMSLLPDGRLKIEEDDGTGKIIQLIAESDSGTFADNRRHWVYFVRNDDHVEIFVDGIEGIPNITDFDQFVSEHDPTKFGGDDRDVVIVAGIDFKDTRFSEYINYTGCLSNVMVELDNFNIYPLDTAFGYQPGGEKLQFYGSIQQSKCMSSRGYSPETTTPSPSNFTWYRGPTWKPPPVIYIPFSVPQRVDEFDLEVVEANTKRVALAMGAFLLVLLIALGIYLWRLDWKDKQYRYEEGMENMDSPSFQGKKNKLQDGNVKAVSFQRTSNSLYDKDRGNATEMVPLNSLPIANNSVDDSAEDDDSSIIKRTPSEDLEWDPGADNTDLLGGTKKPSEVNQKCSTPAVSPPDDGLPLFPPPYDEAVKRHEVPSGLLSPIYIHEGCRTFNNPISYLGGPRISYDAMRNRDSILSLD